MSLPVVLASTSPFRRELLEKTTLTFSIAAPLTDEQALPDESAAALVERLAIAKAKALGGEYPAHVLIGSDQVAVVDGVILGKPGSIERAHEQLRNSSGKCVTFYTGLAVYNSASDELQHSVETFMVKFRDLTDAEISRYIELEQPLQCAGSFKSEGLGIALFEWLRGDDPNSLIGLPIIRLLEMLRRWNINPLIAR